MNKKKAYCIVKKGEYIYLPVKALQGPYRHRRTGVLLPGYLAGMPNFFGGTVEGRENIFLTLIREVQEESQDAITIRVNPDVSKSDQITKMERACRAIMTETPMHIQERPDRATLTDYYFYLFDADRYAAENEEDVTISGFTGNLCALSLEPSGRNIEEKRREMSCILKVSAADCTDINAFLTACVSIDTSGSYLKSLREINAEGSNWLDPGTKDAFAEFCAKRMDLMR